ncbi:MAG: type II secretion system protein [Candidatus Magnetomorum sp.]|nr:type II secretion system protein [Candidatus Magnetomorum sp.]
MNNKKNRSDKGFTLLEMTATLMIVGLLVGLAGLYITNVVDAYALYQEHTEAAQKGRFVINRLVNEFIHLERVINGNEKSISFESRYNNLTDAVIEFKNNTIEINHVVFVDKVHDFNLRYLKSKTAFDDVSSQMWNNSWLDGSTAIQFDISFALYPSLQSLQSKNIITFNNITVVPRAMAKKE